jgi:hypothetical protein
MKKVAQVWDFCATSTAAFAVATLVALAPANAGSVSNPVGWKMVPTGKGYGVLVPQAQGASPPGYLGTPINPGPNGVNYAGGPIMSGRPNIYFIYYGAWADALGKSIVLNFGQHIGGSPYFLINSSYFENTLGFNNYVTGILNFVGSVTDVNSQGAGVTNLSDTQILNIVKNFINNNNLLFPNGTSDPNGIYVVLGDSNINQHNDANTQSLCNNYCGWHNHATVAGNDVKYSFIGNPAICSSITTIDSCIGHANNEVVSPNGDVGPDAMASIIAHELSETVSDPDLNAWYAGDTAHENGDLCAYCFGSDCSASNNPLIPTSSQNFSPVGNGSDFNVRIGTLRYLIQKMYLNARGGLCSLTK